MTVSPKLRTAIIGSGNIGTDLLVKIMRSPFLTCSLFVGRKLGSQGMEKARNLGVRISVDSIDALKENPDLYDLVFDATSASDHHHHWPVLRSLEKTVIDMTPSHIGEMVIPAIKIDECVKFQNVNMISCGGQASIPLAVAITQAQSGVEYIEVVSSISSPSAGPATRINIDEYIETTQDGLKFFSGCDRVKAILVLNPAVPCIDMQTTISAKVSNPDMGKVRASVADMVRRIQCYVPGYKIFVPPVYEQNRIVMMVRVRGMGDYLPTYAGNLDIINCAAIATAERYAHELLSKQHHSGE